ncbi:penicillin amidase [Ferrithrix thermotolerans DSM 19514]|uniref:Penicillin amidase n=1 Tax=Ferrithrix thermotolerans DSM 19514 TaxID=1121881 RepID=A0A1M4X2X7_9ACTN|nr:penicillin acylase family protein [Ferrithrix thermotolerans]SHE87757.1 penicillin amidase [Ferrithrix thermotolerans DSM 19514]
MTDQIKVEGLDRPVEIFRDNYGVPHIFAEDLNDAFFAMGYACAFDRLFQMDYDRRRAEGRLGEVFGSKLRSSDVLSKRLQLRRSAERDYEKLSDSTRSIFDCYSLGVNQALAQGASSAEFELVGFEMEPWEPWHSIAIFKIRHILMGMWQHKLANTILLQRAGADRVAQLRDATVLGSPLTVPPLSRLQLDFEGAARNIREVSKFLGFMSEVEPGSNAWVLSQSSTDKGIGAVLCNDSHRALDVPNVYWQAHISCDEFDVFGATFAGFPGFPHFGVTRDVAWAITHGGADTQDLYIEQLEDGLTPLYRTPKGMRPLQHERETLSYRDGSSEVIDVYGHDDLRLVHGSPEDGWGISLRWTGAEPYAYEGFEVLIPMLRSKGVDELLDSQTSWVDPIQNFVAADKDGSIGYIARGRAPLATRRGFGYPGLSWDDSYSWKAVVPASQMPRMTDPQAGFIMTANNVIQDGDSPYISFSFADPFRAERLRQRLMELKPYSLEDMDRLQADVTSFAAVRWAEVLLNLDPLDSEEAERARVMLSKWNGELTVDSSEALLYGCFRRGLAEVLYAPTLGEELWSFMVKGELGATSTLIRRWLANDIWDLLGGERPGGYGKGVVEAAKMRVLKILPQALEMAYYDATAMAGSDPTAWRWGDHHYVEAQHPLALMGVAKEVDYDFPKVEMGGDSDTIQAASYGWERRTPFRVTGLSVFRQIVDMGDPSSLTSVVPGGASGDANSQHFFDQLAAWGVNKRVVKASDKKSLIEAGADRTTLVPSLG